MEAPAGLLVVRWHTLDGNSRNAHHNDGLPTFLSKEIVRCLAHSHSADVPSHTPLPPRRIIMATSRSIKMIHSPPTQSCGTNSRSCLTNGPTSTLSPLTTTSKPFSKTGKPSPRKTPSHPSPNVARRQPRLWKTAVLRCTRGCRLVVPRNTPEFALLRRRRLRHVGLKS